MTDRIKQIMALIEKEANSRKGADEVSRLHGVQMDISLALFECMNRIREKESIKHSKNER